MGQRAWRWLFTPFTLGASAYRRTTLPSGHWRHCLTAHLQETLLFQTIAIVLVILWLLGIVSSYTMGGFIHILLVAALIMVLLRLIQGRRL
jgi:hypothetical protein